jgi:hypothetical protein
LFESLVYKVFVLWLRERERTKEVPAVQKNLLLKKKFLLLKQKKEQKTKKREKKKVSISAAVLSLFYLFCVTTFVSRLAFLSKV